MDAIRYTLESARDEVGQENLLPQEDMNQGSIDTFERLVPSLRQAVQESDELNVTQREYLDDAFASMKTLSIKGVMEKTQKHFETPYTTLEDTANPTFDIDVYTELVEIFEGMPDVDPDEKEETIRSMRNLGALFMYWDQTLAYPRAAQEHIESVMFAQMEFTAIDIYEAGMEQIVRAYNGLGVEMDLFKDIPGAPQTQAEYALDLDQAQRETFETYVIPALKANPGWIEDPTTADALALLYGEWTADQLVREYFGGATIKRRYVSQPIHNALRDQMITLVHAAKYRNQLDTSSADVFNVTPTDAVFFNFSQPLLTAFTKGVTGPEPVLFTKYPNAVPFVGSLAQKYATDVTPMDIERVGPTKPGFAKTPKRRRVPPADQSESSSSPGRSRPPPSRPDPEDGRTPKRPKGLSQSEPIGENIRHAGTAEQTALMIRTATERFSAISDRLLQLLGVAIPQGWTTSACLQEAWSTATLLAQLEEVFETGEIPIGFRWYNPVTAVGNVAIKIGSVTGRTILGGGQALVNACGRLVKGSADWLKETVVVLGNGLEPVAKSPKLQALGLMLAVVGAAGYAVYTGDTSPFSIGAQAFSAVSTVSYGFQALNIATSLKDVYAANKDKQRNAAIAAALIQFVPLVGEAIFSAFALPGVSVFRELNMLSTFTFSGIATVQLMASIFASDAKKVPFKTIIINSLSRIVTLGPIGYQLAGGTGLVAAIMLGGLIPTASAKKSSVKNFAGGATAVYSEGLVDASQTAPFQEAVLEQGKGIVTTAAKTFNEFDKSRTQKTVEQTKKAIRPLIDFADAISDQDVDDFYKAVMVLGAPIAAPIVTYYRRQAVHATMRSVYEIGDKRLHRNLVLASTSSGLAAGLTALGTSSVITGSASAVADSIGLAGALGPIGTSAGTVATTIFSAPIMSGIATWTSVVGIPATLVVVSTGLAYLAYMNQENTKPPTVVPATPQPAEPAEPVEPAEPGEPAGPSGPPPPPIPSAGVPETDPARIAWIQAMYESWDVELNADSYRRQMIIRRLLRQTRASTPPAPRLRLNRRRLRATQSMPPLGLKIGQDVDEKPPLRSNAEIMLRIAQREQEFEEFAEQYPELANLVTTSAASIAEAYATQYVAKQMLIGLPGPVRLRSSQIPDPDASNEQMISLQAYAQRVFRNNPDAFTEDFKLRHRVLDELAEPIREIVLQLPTITTSNTGIVPQPSRVQQLFEKSEYSAEELGVESYIEFATLIEVFVDELSG